MEKSQRTWKTTAREWLEDFGVAVAWWAIITLLVLFSGAPSKFIYIDF